MSDSFPELPAWQPTRDSLHAYSRVLGALRGALTPPHPRWWHVSLRVEPAGLGTGELGADGSPRLTLDLRGHRLLAVGDERGGQERLLEIDLRRPPTAADAGERLIAALAAQGLAARPEDERWADAAPRRYEPEAAQRYLAALRATRQAFGRVRSALAGEVGPIQLWPHHFDLSFERFGSRRVAGNEGTAGEPAPAQIGFGFSTGDELHPEAYFYANPWPLDAALTAAALPAGARWQTDGWQGTLLPYAAVVRDGPGLLDRYLLRVHELAAPGLEA